MRSEPTAISVSVAMSELAECACAVVLENFCALFLINLVAEAHSVCSITRGRQRMAAGRSFCGFGALKFAPPRFSDPQ
jgi:hypothetical protein